MAYVQQWIQSCRPLESSKSHLAPDPSCFSNTSGATSDFQTHRSNQFPRDYGQAAQQTGDMFSTLSVSDRTSLIDHSAHSILSSDATSAEPMGQPGYGYQQTMAPTFWYTLEPSQQYHPYTDLPPTTTMVHPTVITTSPSAIDDSLSPWSSSLILPQSEIKDSVMDHLPQQSQYSPLPQTRPKLEETSCQQGLDRLSALVNPWTQFYHQSIVSPSLSSSSSATSLSSSSSTPSCAGSSPSILHFSVEASSNPAILYPETTFMTRTPAEANRFEFSYPPQQPSYTSTSSPSLTTSASDSYSNPSVQLQGTFIAPIAHKFTPRASSILTRRQSSVLALKNPVGPLSQSFASVSDSDAIAGATTVAAASTSTTHRRSSLSTSSSSPSSTTTCSSTLTCQVCKKRYANNSTLRRHLKIHAYANSTHRSLSLLRSAGHGIGDGSPASRAARHLLSVPPPHGSGPSSPSTALVSFRGDEVSGGSPPSHGLSSPLPLQGIGYSPGSDPDIKKPECVGCNKAFARRDTVILHIKNKKRKWDLLNAMLPALTADPSASSSSVSVSPISMAMLGGPIAITTGGSSGRRVQRQRKSHPYRMVEKLWQSTLQKKGLILTSSPSSSRSATTAMTMSNSSLSSESRYGSIEGVKLESSSMGLYPVALGGHDGNDENDVGYNDGDDDDALEGEEEDTIGEDGWPSLETMSRMDSQIKLRWMMKMMVMPPCWTERKVRLFGAFGVMEEKVLQ